MARSTSTCALLRYTKKIPILRSVELDSLVRRENQLVNAQEQRIKTSQTQAFWWGFGQGDGIEASELANARGEKESVRNAMKAKVVENPPAAVKRRLDAGRR